MPLEMLEMLLIKAYLFMIRDTPRMTLEDIETRPFVTLSKVASGWWQTLVGWPQSTTPLWVRHKIQRLLKGESVVLYDT